MTTMQPVSWREERRRDRVAEAQIARENEAARAKLRREDDQVSRAERRSSRRQQAARRADLAAWLRGHVTGLLFVPVIAVPGALAWTAMAAYGVQVFGPAGVALPAFSEGAMWAFAGSVTITRHRHPERPVWHLRAGTVLFAAVGAAMNFIHGVTPEHGALRGLGTGIVMALISVAGVVAHQLITAGPRRSRAEHAAARRERAASRVALCRAVAVLDAGGGVRLVHEPATLTLARHWGRMRLADAPQRALLPAAEAVPEARPWPRPAPVLSLPAGPSVSPEPASDEVPQTSAARRPAAASNGASKPAARKPQKSASKPSERRAAAERLLHENPGLTAADLVERAGVSKATADRIRSQVPGRRLHVAGG